MTFRKILVLLMVVGLAGCVDPGALDVRPRHLRDLTVISNDAPMMRGEQRQRFYGAVGLREREQRLGHYYTVLWKDASVGEPVRLVFEYQQGASGSRILRQELDFGEDEVKGRGEFQVIGDAYIKGGRVLAWKCSLFRGKREVASRHSYLWE